MNLTPEQQESLNLFISKTLSLSMGYMDTEELVKQATKKWYEVNGIKEGEDETS